MLSLLHNKKNPIIIPNLGPHSVFIWPSSPSLSSFSAVVTNVAICLPVSAHIGPFVNFRLQRLSIYLILPFPLFYSLVSAVAGLLRSLLVSILHPGSGICPHGCQASPVHAQTIGRPLGQEGAQQEKSGGGVAWGWISGRRGTGLGCGAARSRGLWGQRESCEWKTARNIALSRTMVLQSLVSGFCPPQSPGLPMVVAEGSQCGFWMD